MIKRPNIIYFVADQMRADALHHLGNSASLTPSLDHFLEDAVSFRNAYCQNPVCVPSRCSFLTGLYPHTLGHRTMHFLQNDDEPNILKTMKENGYEVCWIGRNDLYPSNKTKEHYCDFYFDGYHFDNGIYKTESSFSKFTQPQTSNASKNYLESGYYSFYIGEQDKELMQGTLDWGCIRSALSYLEEKATEENGKPFFLYCTLMFPHPPYGCEKPFFGSTDRNNLPKRRKNIQQLKNKPSILYEIERKQNLSGWNDDKWNELRATYLDMTYRFDTHFGMVINQLKKLNLYEDTSIFVFSDHGDYTGDYGIVEKVQNCFENPISNIPLMIKPARGIPVSPRITPALAELVDLSATVAEMAGIRLPYTQFGLSLLSVLAGNDIGKDAVFCEGGRIHGEIHCMEKGHGPESLYWPRLSSQESEGPEHTKAVMIRMGNYKYVHRLYEMNEFYDLSKDPEELNNCIGDPAYKQIIQKMQLRLLDHMIGTADFVPDRKDPR